MGFLKYIKLLIKYSCLSAFIHSDKTTFYINSNKNRVKNRDCVCTHCVNLKIQLQRLFENKTREKIKICRAGSAYVSMQHGCISSVNAILHARVASNLQFHSNTVVTQNKKSTLSRVLFFRWLIVIARTPDCKCLLLFVSIGSSYRECYLDTLYV